MTRTHKGIEIRAEINGQPILHANSLLLHAMGKQSQYTAHPSMPGATHPAAPAGWGYLLGMPFAPAPVENLSVLSLLYRAGEFAEAPDDEDQADDELGEGWTIVAGHRDHRPILVTRHVCGYTSDPLPYLKLRSLIADLERGNVHDCREYRG